MSVILETTIGDLVIDLFTEERPRGNLLTELTQVSQTLSRVTRLINKPNLSGVLNQTS